MRAQRNSALTRDEWLAINRMVAEGCPNVKPDEAAVHVVASPVGKTASGGASMISLNVDSHIHGFDEPLGLLSDCHRRIEYFLGVLIRVARDSRGRELTSDAEKAVRTAQRYFAEASPKHTADEEESLFPVMKAAADARGTSCRTIDQLEADHEEAGALHLRVDALLEAWLSDGRLGESESQELLTQLERLQDIYIEHIRIEDNEVFPLAAELLTAEQLTKVGREMQARRGLKSD